MKLTIIGNGFDLYHGIQSKYSDFAAYLKEQNRNLFDTIEEYFPDNCFWNDFETSLAYFDTDQAIENAENFLHPYSIDSWRDAYHHDYQYELNEIVSALSSKLHQYFCKWIRSIKISKKEQIIPSLLQHTQKDQFLSFNYTKTLTIIYNISTNRILHIHGNTLSSDKDIILGHAWASSERTSLNANINTEETDHRITEGNQIIDSYFEKTFKPTARIIKKNNSFFESLQKVDQIDIMGHSLSLIDLPYFQEIISHIKIENTSWRVSYYNAEAKESNIRAMHDLGIQESNIQHMKLNQF